MILQTLRLRGVQNFSYFYNYTQLEKFHSPDMLMGKSVEYPTVPPRCQVRAWDLFFLFAEEVGSSSSYKRRKKKKIRTL